MLFGRELVLYSVALLGVLYFPGSHASCNDRLGNCKAYDHSTCSQYRQWSKENCADTCGFCDSCPSGWKYYSGDRTCLKIFGLSTFDGQGKWDEARQRCQNFKGGNLVIIRDEYKNNFVKKMSSQNRGFWIGAKNHGGEGEKPTYVDGTSTGSYHPFQNPNSLWQKCVMINYDGYWYYRGCDFSRPYVCQRPATG